MTIHALWCHPRSVSTAFERIMRERGDLTVLHEPFMYHYYLNGSERLFPEFQPAPGHPATYPDIRAMIRQTASEGPLFFKDMAYYVADLLPQDTGFASDMTHTFLVRDPAEAALSYARLDPDFTRTELGHEAQFVLYDQLVAMGHDPLVLSADHLRRDTEATMRRYWRHAGLSFAPHAFSWDDTVPKDWEAVQGWHGDVLQSGAIKAPAPGDATDALAKLGAPYTDYVAHHAPFYAKLRNIAERQAHQK